FLLLLLPQTSAPTAISPLSLHDALPIYDTRATIARLEALVARLKPDTLIALGDSFHDMKAAERMDAEDAARLARLSRSLDWIWIDRKSTRLNSSHVKISYAVFCLKKKKI